ncbi:hypothetical protein ACHAWU_008208 [Discostella pseudostelligera]|uniref:Uncharacterized protein n=1 Tax=Discostella pseudostelligera TaxID=259834 RepID=A0ABD3M6Q9_9STRA
MKLATSIFATALGLSAAAMEVTPKAAISATSRIGQNVLSKARRLEDANAEISYTWVANMSLKFQGCYHTQTWNGEANGDEDVKISTQRLVRFRLCPSSSCTMENAAGCSAGYGDYIIGMEEYLQAYFEAVEEDQKYSCEYEKNYGDCICNGENQGDDFNAEYCEYDCYMGKGMEYCVDKNPYEENNGNNNKQNQEMELREMAECRQLEVNNNNNNRRQLEDAQAAYYLGAYCSENGGSIHLGLFTEETCSQFADANAGATTYATLTGKSLPYSGTTLIGSECMSCKEPQEVNQNGENQNNANDQEDADQVKEVCEQLYANSGKCEANLSNSNVKYPNNNACNFMQGIKIVRKNGTIIRGAGSLNTTASIFIGLFACSFVLIGGYVYYLKTKLDRARVNLSE